MSAFLYRLLCGFLIGVGCILPGVSGGVMAVSFGLYEPMLNALTGFFRDVRKHTAFLLPLVLGGAAGVLLCAGGLAFAMSRWEKPMLFLFLGLILGGVPALWRNARKQYHPHCLWALVPGALLLCAMWLTGDHPQFFSLTPLQWLLAGGIYAIGTVFPGLSASFLLIRLGWYQPVLEAFSTLSPEGLLPFGAGFILVTLLTLHAVQRFFARLPGHAAMGVLGLLAASVLPAVPQPSSGMAAIAELLLLLMGICISLAMERLGGQKQQA